MPQEPHGEGITNSFYLQDTPWLIAAKTVSIVTSSSAARGECYLNPVRREWTAALSLEKNTWPVEDQIMRQIRNTLLWYSPFFLINSKNLFFMQKKAMR